MSLASALRSGQKPTPKIAALACLALAICPSDGLSFALFGVSRQKLVETAQCGIPGYYDGDQIAALGQAWSMILPNANSAIATAGAMFGKGIDLVDAASEDGSGVGEIAELFARSEGRLDACKAIADLVGLPPEQDQLVALASASVFIKPAAMAAGTAGAAVSIPGDVVSGMFNILASNIVSNGDPAPASLISVASSGAGRIAGAYAPLRLLPIVNALS
jgi:hypothetical protein